MASRFSAGIERRAFGNGPGFQRAVDFQAEIVVQMRGVVALDAELQRAAMRGFGVDGAGSGVWSKWRFSRTF